jgi:hypothetical protein
MMGGLFPCLHYMKMSQRELFDGYIETLLKMYSFESLYHKANILFGSGHFTASYNDGNPGIAFRFSMTMKLAKEFIFTREKFKRKLYLYIIGLIRKKKLAIDMGLSYILSMTSYNRHIKRLASEAPFYQELISKYDKGPWEKIANNKPDVTQDL